jgi:glycosyltransferase involved in cell wall biosynthesis
MRLVIVGKGPEEGRLKRSCRKLGLERSVLFIGPQPLETIPAVLGSASIFLFASEIETQALGLIEAMAAGIPVVAVDSPATRDALAGGGGALTKAEPGDFAQAVLNILDRPGRLMELSALAHRAAQAYAIPILVKKLENVYQDALKRSKTAGY